MVGLRERSALHQLCVSTRPDAPPGQALPSLIQTLKRTDQLIEGKALQ